MDIFFAFCPLHCFSWNNKVFVLRFGFGDLDGKGWAPFIPWNYLLTKCKAKSCMFFIILRYNNFLLYVRS